MNEFRIDLLGRVRSWWSLTIEEDEMPILLCRVFSSNDRSFKSLLSLQIRYAIQMNELRHATMLEF